MSCLRIGNAQGFWGDNIDAPAQLVKQQPNLDFLTLDYLSEVSLSIMAIQKEKDPQMGFAKDFLEVVRSLIPHWKEGSQVKVISNAGGLAPAACAQACALLLKETGLTMKIGVVSGDDVLHLLKQDAEEKTFHHLETEEPLTNKRNLLVTANAYIGAEPIAQALRQGAQIVITGRIADPSLTVGPCLAHFGWRKDEYDKIAGSTIAGHLIECGTQVTGGISTNWLEIANPAEIGFPIAEVNEDGSCIITKALGTSGCVNEQTVKEQLLYEIGDPENYLSPDATVSFLSLLLESAGENRIRLSGARGRPAPINYKVSATYRNGYRAEGMLVCFGPQADLKAKRAGEMILEKLRKANCIFQKTQIECLGAGDVVPGVFPRQEVMECVLRICVMDPNKESVERFTKELAPLVTSGPQGLTGYTSGRPHVRSVFGYWPCLIAREKVKPMVEILEVK